MRIRADNIPRVSYSCHEVLPILKMKGDCNVINISSLNEGNLFAVGTERTIPHAVAVEFGDEITPSSSCPRRIGGDVTAIAERAVTQSNTEHREASEWKPK